MWKYICLYINTATRLFISVTYQINAIVSMLSTSTTIKEPICLKYICNEIMNNCSIIQETANDNGYIWIWMCAKWEISFLSLFLLFFFFLYYTSSFPFSNFQFKYQIMCVIINGILINVILWNRLSTTKHTASKTMIVRIWYEL